MFLVSCGNTPTKHNPKTNKYVKCEKEAERINFVDLSTRENINICMCMPVKPESLTEEWMNALEKCIVDNTEK